MSRNSKYDPATMPEQCRKLATLGLIQEEIAKFFGVSERTFKYWLRDYPELRAAMNEGGLLADAEVGVSLYKRACGYSHPDEDIRTVSIGDGKSKIVKTQTTKHYPPDTMAMMYWLNNRQRARFSKAPDPAMTSDDIPPTKVIFEVRDARKPERDSGEPQPAAS